MKPYRPSMAVPMGGLLKLILAAVIGGAVIGGLVSLLSNLIYLVFVFPMVMGVVAGVMVAAAVRSGKIRNPPVAICAALLAGIMVYGTMWAVDYIQFRNAQIDQVLKAYPQADWAKADAVIDIVLVEETGQAGFVGYVLYQSQEGVSIGRVTSSSKGIHFTAPWTWVYWGFEFLLILGIAVITGKGPSAEPFCEACGRWYGSQRRLGTLGATRSKELLAMIEAGQFAKLGEELQSNPATPNLSVFIATCGKDCTAGETFLAVRSQTRDSKGNLTTKDVVKGMITPFQAQDLQRGVEARQALYGN